MIGAFQRSFVLVFLFLGAIGIGFAGPEKAISTVPVSVDPRVELISIIFRLAGAPEYGMCQIPSYTSDIKAHFAPVAEHPVVKLARKLFEICGVGYDAPMSVTVHLTEGLDLEERVPFFPRPKEIDDRWTSQSLREFRILAKQFVKDSNFAEFFAEHQLLFEKPVKEMEEIINKEVHLEWFSEFFKFSSPIHFRVILAINNGGCNYGARFQNEDLLEAYCILGVWKTDAAGKPKIDESVIPTFIHEFCHSFANPIIDAHLCELKKSCEKIFGYVHLAMEQMAYGHWEIMMRETLVRTSVIRYFKKLGKTDIVKAEIESNTKRGFIWIGEFVDLFDLYEADRKKYPDIEAFMPQIVKFFEGYASKMAAIDATKPHVVSMSPANDSPKVDSAIKELRVTFDRPMKQSCAWCGGGENYPETPGKSFWTADRKTCVLPVKLKPNWSYKLFLNSAKFKDFASEDGIALDPVTYFFSTDSVTR